MSDIENKTTPVRVLLSYARGDDEAFVKRLHADLTSSDFIVWFDRESLMSRGLTFHQEIKDAIRAEVERVVYVAGPKAAISNYVREEWQFALECDHVVVTPILRLGDYDHVPGELSLRHCEDFRDDAKYPDALAKLIAGLRQPNPRLGALFAVPNLPANFLGRPELMRRVRDALLVDLQKPQVITGADARVGMQGMGGIGKSVLAAALARNREVRQSYPDGIVWISCGQKLNDDDLLKRQRDLARHIGSDENFSSLEQGKGVLRQVLAAKAILLVLDDVWRAADAQAFDVLGPRCRMLVTTRDKGILDTLHGELVQVSLFTEPEALQLLADSVNLAASALPAEAREVARECGYLPLALALSGGMARKRGGDFHSVLERLRRADLDKIADRESINEQHRSIWRAMQASVEMLPESEQQRFSELSVFVTDQKVPEATAATLWSHTGNLDDLDTEELLINLFERSLIQLDQKTGTDGKVRRTFRLHDLLHDYAMRIAGEPKLLHQKLLDAYAGKCSDGWPTGPDDGYFFQNLIHHIAATGAWPECEATATNFSWLMRKCEVGLLDSISSDYEMLREEAPTEVTRRLQMWADFFREKAHILRRGIDEWPAHKILLQLAVEHADDSPLTLAAEKWLMADRCSWFWLRRVPRLPHIQKDSCFLVLEGHTSYVKGALALTNGRLLSWSCDGTLRLWDSHSGACLTVLEGHTNSVLGAQVLPDGRLLSWSADATLRLWDDRNGACLAVFEGHTESVYDVLVLAGGRVLSQSSDKTLRVWNAQTGECFAVLEGHSEGVLGAMELTDGRILSWSEDTTLRLWDARDGACLAVLRGHTQAVTDTLKLDDERVLTYSGYADRADRTLRLWNIRNWTCLAVLEGHTDQIKGALVLDRDRVLSWSADRTLRAWSTHSGSCLAVLEGHRGQVDGALALDDGRILSWSTFRGSSVTGDSKLRLWNIKDGSCLVLEGHVKSICGVLQLDRERLLSWSETTMRVWDTKSGACLAVLEGHTGAVKDALALTDERLLSWSWSADNTLRLWDTSKAACLAVFEGHTDAVNGALALADGRVLSWSDDATLRLWDGQSVGCQAALEGSPIEFSGSLALADGRALLWAADGKLRLWDIHSASCRIVLDGHTAAVYGVLSLIDGHLLSWGADGTLRLWDKRTGVCLAVLEGHTGGVRGAMALANGRVLSWELSFGYCVDELQRNALRLWDPKSGALLMKLEGHTSWIEGALALADGRLLSWSLDNTLRLWDGQSGICLALFKGHSARVNGALVLNYGRLLSWSDDATLRIWDMQSGECLAVLRGHIISDEDTIQGALALGNGQILSWSLDKTLRLWDGQSGDCMAVLEGHTRGVRGAVALADGRLLSWSYDSTFRLWDGQSGLCLEVVSEAQISRRHPDWLHARINAESIECVFQDFAVRSSARQALLRHKAFPSPLAVWHAVSEGTARCLFANGGIVFTRANGQVCILKLHHGNRRLSLAEAEELLGLKSRGQTSDASGQKAQGR